MAPQIAGCPKVSPKLAGLDPAPFHQLKEALRHETHQLQCISGGAHIVLHRGRCVLACSDGWANRRTKHPWSLDTICKLHGCTKPLVSAAFLTLVDDGTVKLSDPISKYVKFSEHLKPQGRAAAAKRGAAAAKTGARAGRLRRVSRPATLQNLLTMTAGLGYEDTPSYKRVMRQVRDGRIRDLAGLCREISELPLVSEPGTRYTYSFCTDFLGHVCEAISGQRLDKFVEARLLRPLGMRDTHFAVPAAKRGRLAVLYDAEELPRRGARRTRFRLKTWSHPEKAPGIMSAGGGVLSYEDAGMYSTARDYAKFVQLLLEGGKAADGRRVLSERTARALWGDALAAYSRRDGRLPGWNDAAGPKKGGLWDYTGCSLLHTHLVFEELPRGSGPPRRAQSMWMGGGGGCYWVVDRKRRLASISFTQAFGGRRDDTDEIDGLGPRGNDASTFAEAAVDSGRAAGGAKAGKRIRTA